MGENKHIEELDAFAKKYVKEIKRAEIPVDFTKNLMHKLQQVEIKNPMKATPLISKKVWVILFLGFVSLFFIPFKSVDDKYNVFDKVDLSFLDKLHFSTIFESITISSIVMYAFLLFGIMIFVQIVYLKNHFNQRFH